MATSNVPVPQFGPNGFVAPAEADIFAGVTTDIDAAFGGGLNPDATTPQGQLATSETAIIGNANDVFVKMTQQFDPAYADGRMQDALARIYFLERDPSEPTVVQADCGGAALTPIPIGALAKSADGNQWLCTDGGVIPVGGIITLTFECVTPGPISCPPNSLTVIYRAIPGWDTINNPAEGVLGRLTESRNEFEQRRQQSVALNALGVIPAIKATVLNVPGVLDAYVRDNSTGSPVSFNGVELAANSLYVAVVGGVAADVAAAIWRKKMPGCAYTGNTTVTVTDGNSGYSVPFPTYDVTFEIPSTLPILFSVQIANTTGVPANAPTLIRAAIINAFSGSDGGSRAQIGSTIFASRYYAAVALLGPWAQIVSITIGSQNDPSSVITASIAGAVMTVTAVASGAIAVGDTILGEGVLAGTTVIGFGSGSGGTGTYNLSKAQTRASGTLSTAKPELFDLIAQIDQVPTISGDDIAVSLV